MKSRVLTLALLALPAGVLAQGLALRPPSLGDAMENLRRAERAGRFERPRRDGGELEQTFIVPERPGQNQVAWYDFEWRRHDVPPPGGGPGGIRLYFYESERAVAERALPAIKASFVRLVDQFHYSPTKKIPYILYSSHREFQTTNLFAIGESVLGVTSPEDLKMSLPYFGEHEKFREVSMHEMVHQFTIQKLLDVADADELDSPIDNLPLWFIEGIAEYYAKGGLDVETEMYLRDLVWNADPERRYEILPFPEDRLRGYIPTYKLGQARIAFIAETYGKEKIQGFLENAYQPGAPGAGGAERSFAVIVRRVLNEPLDQVDARWRAWMKKRYYPQYTQIRQDLPQVREARDLPAEPDSIDVSPDGQVLFFRGIDRERGRARLYVLDPRYPRGAIEVASDNVPGIESLHPIERDVLAIGDGILAFSAQSGHGDALYVHKYRHTPPSKGRPPRLELGERKRITVSHPDGARFIEISDPAFSPDGKEIAFVGLTQTGQQDVFVVPARGGVSRRVTNDPYAERGLFWAADGIYCASDATDHGLFNLFRIDPATGARTRLTTAPTNDGHPRVLTDGSVLFSSDAGGKVDLHLLKDGAVKRLTDFVTVLSSPALAPGARGIWATSFYRGSFKLVEVPKAAWLDDPPVPVAPAAGTPLQIPTESIPPDVTTYDAMSLKNWRPETGIVYGGGAGSTVAGRAAVLFSDLMRDHVLFLDLAIYGSLDLTQGLALYENRSRRSTLAFGVYHFVQQQIDRLDQDLAYFQRDFGVVTAIRHPLDRFRRVEAELSFGGVNRYCLTDFAVTNFAQCEGVQVDRGPGSDTADWQARNGGVHFTLNPTLRFGYDTVRYDMYTGPLAGSSFLLEVGGGWLPGPAAVHGFVRTDAAWYYPLVGRANFMLRGAGGTSFAPNLVGKTWARTWWLTSADNLRGFGPFDLEGLIGQHFYVVNAELQLPLDPLIRLVIFDYIEGVAAVDFGGVFDRFDTRGLELGMWDSRTLTGVLGFNVLFGPLLLRVHFGHPFDIGGVTSTALARTTNWATNITLRYFFF
jgi:hypothetical protein